MDFTLTDDQLDLKARAGALARTIAVHELDCEEHNGLADDVLAELADAVRASGLEMAAHVVRGDFGFDGSLTLTDAEVRGTGAALSLDGNRPSQVPEFAASATVSWFTAALAAMYAG